MDEINKLNDLTVKYERDFKTKEEIIQNEIHSLKQRINEISSECEKNSLKINENITYLKKLDETKLTKENEFKTIQQDRENIALEYERKSNIHNEIISKINSLSISIKNFDQNKDKLNHKVKNMNNDVNLEYQSILKKSEKTNVRVL